MTRSDAQDEPRFRPVTDPYDDAPDGVVVDGWERQGMQWVRLTPEARQQPDETPPQILLILDEAAEVMATPRQDNMADEALRRLVQIGRDARVNILPEPRYQVANVADLRFDGPAGRADAIIWPIDLPHTPQQPRSLRFLPLTASPATEQEESR